MCLLLWGRTMRNGLGIRRFLSMLANLLKRLRVKKTDWVAVVQEDELGALQPVTDDWMAKD